MNKVIFLKTQFIRKENARLTSQEMSENVEKVKKTIQTLGLKYEFLYHKKDGTKTEDAGLALGVKSDELVKVLLFISRDKQYVGAIVRGSDRVNVKALERSAGLKDLRMASSEEVSDALSFEIGGVPPLAFYESHIPAFVDQSLLTSEQAIGSGGSPFVGMRFSPKDLIDVFGYSAISLSKNAEGAHE